MNKTANSFLRLDRLRVMSRGRAVYDQRFHQGVNIIRGDNSSGKSTIADFIFFILGGDFKEWKPATAPVDEVQAEITTPSGKLSLRREKTEGRPPVWVFFGNFAEGADYGVDKWERFPIQRVQSNLSFSEVLFKSMLLPVAQSDGASNITNHQLMRLLYSDQRTPAPRLFRFESFDKATIRTAVGDLICGIRSFSLFEIELEIRELESQYSDLDRKWTALLNSFPDQIGVTVGAIKAEIKNIEEKLVSLKQEVELVDQNVSGDQNSQFYKDRKSAVARLKKLRENLSKASNVLEQNQLDKVELERFISHLNSSLQMLKSAEEASEVLGTIDFSHCPSCLKLLPDDVPDLCRVCGQDLDHDQTVSRYNQIRVDLELQIKESKQLLSQEIERASLAKSQHMRVQKEFEAATTDFALKFELSNSPREAYLAERHSQAGRLNKEVEQLNSSLQRAAKLDQISKQKEEANGLLTKAKEKRTSLEKAAQRKRNSALKLVSSKAAEILRADTSGAQEEFRKAEHVDLNFEDDAVLLDGLANFSESSNVFLKNASILGLHLAACTDPSFLHPRFVLFDNIEDKGMQVARSHCFQELIVKTTTETRLPNQVIFTTSMMNPELELEDYTIGPYYDEDNKTLDFDRGQISE